MCRVFSVPLFDEIQSLRQKKREIGYTGQETARFVGLGDVSLKSADAVFMEGS
jgi:hypothetical protein